MPTMDNVVFNSPVIEQLDIIRRGLERQLRVAEAGSINGEGTEDYVDYALHLLSEVEATKRFYIEELEEIKRGTK